MPLPIPPGVYVPEIGRGVHRIVAAPMHIAAFVGALDRGPVGTPILLRSLGELIAKYGPVSRDRPTTTAIELFFRNGGAAAWVVRAPVTADDPAGAVTGPGGIGALAAVAMGSNAPAVLLVPDSPILGRVDGARVHDAMIAHARNTRAIAILDVDDHAAASVAAIREWRATAPNDPHAAVYFPRIRLNDGSIASVGGAAAGIWARSDADQGPWKAPAGIDATIKAASTLSITLTDQQRGLLNPAGVNTLIMPIDKSPALWGARTLAGADVMGSEWKYVPVKRTALMIERSILRGCEWAASEPNNERLWARLRLTVGAFLRSLFDQSAFAGLTPRAAYFVKCGEDTMTKTDRDAGTLNVSVGFAPLKPAEFVVLSLRLRALPG